jgi:hypothetical protein
MTDCGAIENLILADQANVHRPMYATARRPLNFKHPETFAPRRVLQEVSGVEPIDAIP